MLSGYWETRLYPCKHSEQGGLPTSVKIDHANVTDLRGWYCSTVPSQIVWFLGNSKEVHVCVFFFFNAFVTLKTCEILNYCYF